MGEPSSCTVAALPTATPLLWETELRCLRAEEVEGGKSPSATVELERCRSVSEELSSSEPDDDSDTKSELPELLLEEGKLGEDAIILLPISVLYAAQH